MFTKKITKVLQCHETIYIKKTLFDEHVLDKFELVLYYTKIIRFIDKFL